MTCQWLLRVAVVSVFAIFADSAGHLDHLPPPPPPPLIQADGMKQSETILPPPPPDRPPPPFPQQQQQIIQQQKQQHQVLPSAVELQSGEMAKQNVDRTFEPFKQIPPPPQQSKDPAVGIQIRTPSTEASQYQIVTPQQQRKTEEQNGKRIEHKINSSVQQPIYKHSHTLYHNSQHVQSPPQFQTQQRTNNAHPQRRSNVGPAYRQPMYTRGPLPQQRRSQSIIWKSLWQKVERGLDVLADMEEAVVDRASQLMHSKSLSSSSSSSSTSRMIVPPKPNPKPPIQPVQSKITPVAPPRSFGNKFDIAKQKNTDQRNTVRESTSRRIDWEQLQSGRTMIQTNGGASRPDPSAPPPRYPATSDVIQPIRRENIFTDSASNQYRPKPIVSRLRHTLLEEDEEKSFGSKLIGRLPRFNLPTMPLSKLLGKGSGSFQRLSQETLDSWKDEDSVVNRNVQRSARYTPPEGNKKSVITPPIADMLNRSENGKSSSLLSSRNIAQCHSIGRSKAILDIACLGLVLLGSHIMLPFLQTISLPSSINDVATTFLSSLGSAVLASSESWAHYAFMAAILTSFTNFVLFHFKIHNLCTGVGQLIRSGTQYCQLYMRLVASTPVDESTQELLQAAAESQVVSAIHIARLRSFVKLALATLVIMTVSILRPIAITLFGGFVEIVAIHEWNQWPIPLLLLLEKIHATLLPVGNSLKDLVISEAQNVLDHPVKMAFKVSTFAALLLVTVMASMEQRRHVTRRHGNEDDVESVPLLFGTVKTLSNLGVSSASRLGLLSKNGALEGTLERWRASIPKPIAKLRYSAFPTFLRRSTYMIISGAILMAPILVYLFAGASELPSTISSSLAIVQWDSIVDVSILLLFTFGLFCRSIISAVFSSTFKPVVSKFVHSLAATVDELSNSNQAGTTKLGTPMSPMKGLSVNDLWTAHSTRRAWSVRGANLECSAGQVIVILGEDGSGKTRLLTAIAEALVSPVKRSLTSSKVRGSISVGGLDATKWDRSELKKRIGLLLNDVRTISDNAEFMSGFTLEEILEPMDGLLNAQISQTRQRSAVNIALDMTGLSTSLLSRLPSKLSTVVTANEDELAPSSTLPRCHSLSPSEWSKLLLARVLAQTIYDNGSSAKSGTTDNALVGSLLLLDDVTAYMSELEEAKTITAFRRSGAATVLTSYKWATGRIADCVIVIKDGAIIESGTHNELLARGPQQSHYAQKWYAMTTTT